MPALAIREAAEKLAKVVEKATQDTLAEVYAELFPEKPPLAEVAADDVARHVRNGLEAEEIVDLWNVLFPEDHDVYYNEETKAIHFNEEMAGYAD